MRRMRAVQLSKARRSAISAASREADVIDKSYAHLMSRYNEWQNANLYGAADKLSDDERRRERGAFFGSIHATLDHLLWGDQIWMSRFAATPKPEGGIKGSVSRHPVWEDLKRERAAFDRVIIDWAANLDPNWLEGDLTYFSGAAGREIKAAKWLLVTHMFNHQTHHRGQVHCMLTQSGAKPGDTDLPFLQL
jgi:uncharacterized damage-inducible protein DinB